VLICAIKLHRESKVFKKDLADYHTWKLASGSVPIASTANANGSVIFIQSLFYKQESSDGAYWLIENNKSLQLYETKDKEQELIFENIAESSWKDDHWKVLRKAQEKSDSKIHYHDKF
jgi:predicted Rossmann fold nucleotide-binding protein DprA/Smf involved in DNA uptake